ncbi:DUF5801 repeats-in-toxin domain-containing protein [Aminobacter sp. MET-1]|uniref:DUF5801 repeats-in-toxin domain-containing protein n=1 Tax=Aminobacter sp. MET-1 TaxID=2951085 RepID=UPI002B401BFF|nr:DUF5801 repeats-in-toxin domain-containing protein [Aminobacter sp. MET-1]MCX8571644.1 DUF5801 domain-containing protein [Aminobacter sp. MET-1]
MSDDVPVAVADTAVSVVEGGAAIGGNVMDNDTPGADGARVTSVTIGGNEHAVAAEGTTTVTTPNGTYTFQSNGAWTFTPVASLNNAEGVSAGFSYVITDGDGDTSSAAQPITITDGDGPTVADGGTITLTVDDQNLTDGSTPDSTPVTGSIVFTPGSDAIASMAFGDTTGLDGGLTWTRVSDTEIVGRDSGGTAVVTLTLVRDGNTAEVTVTLNDNYRHSGSGDDLADLGSVKVIATDTDGDTAEGTVNVGVSDDVPLAVADTAVSVVEGAAAIGGNVMDNDTPGADGAKVTSVTIGGNEHAVAAEGTTTVTTSNGTYTFQSNGTWTFTPVASLNNAEGVSAGFTYVITDGDGDTSSAAQPITITDGAGPSLVGEGLSLEVKESDLDLVKNPNDLAAGAVNGTNPGGTGETNSGTLTFQAGSDALVSFAFANPALVANTITVTDEANNPVAVTWSIDGDGQLVGMIGGAVAIIVAVDGSTIAANAQGTVGVKVTLTDNFPHANGQSGDVSIGGIKVVATDADGDTATGTVSVTVKDDVPTAGSNNTVYLDDETANATNASPNPGGDGDYNGTPAAATTGVLSHNYGADGAGSLLLSGVTLPVSGGFSYVLSPDKLSLTIMQNQGGSNVAVVKVTLADQTSGSYVVEQLKPVMHPTSGTTEENVDFTIRYDVRDGDGDVASGGAVTISVNDDTPTITASNDLREVIVDETNFNVDARVSFASAFTSSYGADGAGSISYALSFTGPATYLVDIATGKSVVLSMEDGQVVGRAGEGGAIVFTISVDADGYLTVDQIRAIEHPVTTDPNDARPFLSENLLQLTATITDRDGDSRSASINLNNNIYFKDDGPSVSANETVLLDDDALANGNPGGVGDQSDKVNASGTLGHSFGADGAGSITWLTTGSAPAGFEYKLNGTTLEVWQGTTKVLTVTLNSATGAYEVTQNAPIAHATGGNENDQVFNLTYQVKDGDGDTIDGTLKISVNDDTPVANDYTGGSYVEGAGAQDLGVATDVLGIKPGADGLGSIVFSNTGGTTGTLSINGAGKLIYTPAANVGPGGKTETFSYTVTDKDGDAVTKQVTFGVTDTGVTNVSATSASVDEDNIAGVGGIPGGPGDLAAPVPSGTISYTLGADGGSGVSVSLSAATVGFTKLDGTPINTIWDAANKVLIGYGGSNQSDVVFKVSLSAIGTLANSANSASYTVELVQPVKHPGHDDPSTSGVTETAFEDDLSISITATVKDGDGSTATTGFTVTIDDDTPLARNDTATVVEGSKPSMNVVLVIDTSGSMDDEDVDPNTPGFQSRLDMAKAAALNLLNSGDVTINQVMVVEFYNGTNVNAPVWGSWSNAADKADIISFINNLYAGGGTSYDAATAAVRASWGAGPTTADLTNVYFLSDGDPDPNSAGLDAAEQAVWQNFLVNPDNNAATNDAIDHVYAVGIGSGVSTGALEPVAWANGNANFPPIVITDATQLSATLQGTLPGNVIGNVLTNDGVAGNAFGADGGYIKSIVIDGVTYTFNGSGAITAGDMSHVISNSGTQIKVSTALGGVLVFNFADNGGNKAGDWGYTAPTSIIGGNKQEGFTYTLIDGDGDTSSATLGITIQDVNGVPTAGTTSGTLDDEGLPHGIAGGINDVPGEAASFSGLLPLSYGSDGAHATDPLSFAAMNGQAGTVGTESVTYSWDNATKTLTAVSATRGAIFKVVIDDLSSGHYAVTLLKPVLHAAGGNENAIDPFVNLTYTVQDLSGDKVNGTLKVTFDDDAPVNFTAQSMRIENGANSAGSGQLHFYESIGADGGSAVFTGTNGSVLKSGSSDVFSGGAQVKLYGFGTDTLVGKIGAAADGSGGTTVFNVKLSPNTGDESSDLYSVQFFKALDDGSGVTITGSNFTDTNARNYKVVDGGASNQDILISASSGSSSTSVNGSNSSGVVSFGAGNPTIGSNETLRFDFASSVQLSGTGANNSFSYGSHYDVNGFSFTVKTGGTSNVLVTVYDADNDSSQGASGLTDDAGSKDTITQIYKNGVLLNLSTLAQSAGGYVVPSNEGDVIAVFTATGYNRAEIAYAAGDVFSIANVGFVKLNTGSNLPLNFNVTATDADGDTATGVIAITTTPPATTLTGTSGDDLLVAGAGGDTLNGQGGNDWLTGGAGADNLNGGTGNDTASYANSTASVRINLDNDGDATTDTASATPSDGQVGGDAFGDNLDSIENLVGGSGDDYLAGNSGQNILMGLGGNDLLFGEGGNDILYGGAGNDTLNGGTGSDTMTGGEGADTFVISADAISGSIDDIITDFNPSQGDVLDLSELLKNISSGTNLETSGYVKIEQSGLDSIVSVDVNGNGDNYQQVAVLKDFTYNSAVSDTIKVLFEDNAGNKHSDNV